MMRALGSAVGIAGCANEMARRAIGCSATGTRPRLHLECDAEALPFATEMFALLESLLPVAIDTQTRTVPGVQLRFGDGGATLALPGFADGGEPARRVPAQVRFAGHADVPQPFRGRTLSTSAPAPSRALAPLPGETVLASTEAGVAWTVSSGDGRRTFRSAWALPRLTGSEAFADIFNGERFVDMLPLLHFLRPVDAYQLPPLRAAFTIDDPNLHWPRYGHVDFAAVAMRASARGYHVVFATIPLDTWYTHAATAMLFRRNAESISLAVHGNNHSRKELALDYSETERARMLGQALQRIERLERRIGVGVSRVMIAPHGACSEAMLETLPRCGFEAACISAGSLRAHNPGRAWTRLLGYFPSEIVRGCAVLPRHGLAGNVEGVALVAAYLGQPIVFTGHHQDLRDRGEALDAIAGTIDTLGDVAWGSLERISRANYRWRLDGTTCRLVPGSTVVAFEPPSEARQIVIESPDGSDGGWDIEADERTLRVSAGEPVALDATKRIVARRVLDPLPLRAQPGTGSIAPSLVVRRLLTEARDRFLPH